MLFNIEEMFNTIKNIKKMAKDASKILLATDPDREGEAIAFHLKNMMLIALANS